MSMQIIRPTLIIALTTLLCCLQVTAQYVFRTEKKINCTAVKNQANTGTCWSFATTSFLESEVIRMGATDIDLSEMYIVRNIYKDKAKNYVLRQGKANFSQGSLAHDLIRMASQQGLVTEEAYSGMLEGETRHNHSEMENGLKGFLDGVRTSKQLSKKWFPAFTAILDAYLGAAPTQFSYQSKNYTPKSFAHKLGINAEDYISITSFTHHPFYDQFILEIPDNYSNGAFYNVPLEEMMSIIDYTLLAGYTISWDGDVSEKGFSARDGIAVLPKSSEREDLFSIPGEEIAVNQINRQENFESYSTTDDHLMHIVGIALDQTGTKYYIIKNSWGEISDHNGYLYMSEAYMKMKTVSVMLHKDAVPMSSATKLFSTAD